MTQRISLRAANQQLSRYIRQLSRESEIIITNRGRPVARLVAVQDKIRLSPAQSRAKKRLMSRLEKGYDFRGSFARAELYDR